MGKNPHYTRYLRYEESLIQLFHQHPFLRSFDTLSKTQLIAFLLQLGHLSAEFVKWYERAKQGFTAESAKEIVRHILHDEIPVGHPTHQDDRLYDLELMGVEKAAVLGTVATGITKQTVSRIYWLARVPQEQYDLKVLITLRIFGEILVGETYGYIVNGIREHFGIEESQSRFYVPHYIHDKKDAHNPEGHTASFENELARLIHDDVSCDIAIEAAKVAYQTRYRFMNQFTPRAQATTAAIRTVTLLLIVSVTACIGTVGHTAAIDLLAQRDRMDWAQFIDGLPADVREFYLYCDQETLRQLRQGYPGVALLDIGTENACRRIYGEGP